MRRISDCCHFVRLTMKAHLLVRLFFFQQTLSLTPLLNYPLRAIQIRAKLAIDNNDDDDDDNDER